MRIPDPMDSRGVLYYRAFLIVLTAAAVVAAALVVRFAGQGFWDQGGGLYVTIALLAFFAWVIGQFVRLARRQKRSSSSSAGRATVPKSRRFNPTRGSETGQTSARNAASAQADTMTFLKTLRFGAASAPRNTQPTQDQIEQADRLQREGRDWESICVAINPRYDSLTAEDKQVYNLLLQAFVAAQRAQRGGGNLA